MLYMEIIAVCSEIHTKHINTPCGQNVELLNVKGGGRLRLKCDGTRAAQKPDFVFRQNGRVHLNRRGASVQSTTGSRGLRISVSNAGYTMFRGSVKSTGYPLHLPVLPSLPHPVRHHVQSHFNWTLRIVTTGL
jgi:hypothetical protein